MTYENQLNMPRLSAIEKARLHVLLLCLVRFVVEKHGGTVETDAGTHDALITIQQKDKADCVEELTRQLGPGTPLHDLLSVPDFFV